MLGLSIMSNALEKILALFGRKPDQSGNSQPSSSLYSQSAVQEGSESAKRGQLVQVLMRNFVRRSGIPTGWIDCQYQVVNSRTRGEGIFVRLVVRKWDERLMKYAFAIQKTLLTDIVQFDPKAISWLRGISWQLEVASSCSITEMPSNTYWQTTTHAPVKAASTGQALEQLKPAAMPTGAAIAQITVPKQVTPVAAMAAASAVAAGVPTAESETAQDLAKLFAIRDQELERMSLSKLLPVGYETTQPIPLSAR